MNDLPLAPHHQQTVDRLAAHFRDDPDFLAVIIGGSVAKGRPRPDSDVDFVLVATDAEYARRRDAGQFFWYSRDFTDYPGGYVDGKVVDLAFLRDVAEQGSEPARAAFAQVFLACSRDPEVDDLVARIPIYPEVDRPAKIASFYSQVLLLNWFVREAAKREDPYLMAHATTSLVLFGGRTILAWNRILFPYHKWFLYELRRAPDKPANFVELAEQLLAHPGPETAQSFHDSLVEFRDWGVTYEQAVNHFLEDSEWNWRDGRPPLADW